MSNDDKRLPDGGTVSPPPPPPPPPPATEPDVETTQPLEHVVIMPKPPSR